MKTKQPFKVFEYLFKRILCNVRVRARAFGICYMLSFQLRLLRSRDKCASIISHLLLINEQFFFAISQELRTFL